MAAAKDDMGTDWTELLGCDLNEFCARFYNKRPTWITGYISLWDAQYLFERALVAGQDTVIEIGTASGISTAYLCLALDFASRAGLVGPDWRVLSYDIQGAYYADPTRRVGDATRELLPPELVERIDFRHPATATDVAREHGGDGIRFLFIDANHRHPWPTLDVLATLDALPAGAEVILHDINLPVRNPQHADWGAKHLFDGLAVEKLANPKDTVPNIGSLWMPEDRARVRTDLIAIANAHEWEATPEPALTSTLLG